MRNGSCFRCRVWLALVIFSHPIRLLFFGFALFGVVFGLELICLCAILLLSCFFFGVVWCGVVWCGVVCVCFLFFYSLLQ